MSTSDNPSEQADLIVTGSVSALRDLAQPAALSQAESEIVDWYGQLVRLLAGPHAGDERGPAGKPSWMRGGPRVDAAELVAEESPGILVEGSGLATTTGVWVDGRLSTLWRVLPRGRLLIGLTEEPGDQIEVLIRTADGDVVA